MLSRRKFMVSAGLGIGAVATTGFAKTMRIPKPSILDKYPPLSNDERVWLTTTFASVVSYSAWTTSNKCICPNITDRITDLWKMLDGAARTYKHREGNFNDCNKLRFYLMSVLWYRTEYLKTGRINNDNDIDVKVRIHRFYLEAAASGSGIPA